MLVNTAQPYIPRSTNTTTTSLMHTMFERARQICTWQLPNHMAKDLDVCREWIKILLIDAEHNVFSTTTDMIADSVTCS